MKAKAVKTTLRVVAYIIVIAVTAVIINRASAETTVQKEKINELEFTRPSDKELTEGEQIIAENSNFTLYADLKDNTVRLKDNRKDLNYFAVPEDLESREDIKSRAKIKFSSLLNIKFADRDSNVSSQNSVSGAKLKSNIAVKKIGDGIRFEYLFDKEGFVIPLEIKLTENGFTARVPIKEIQERSDSVKLTAVSVLPNFGAGALNSEGYIFVPDGSGAVIPYTENESQYSQRIYGNDPAVAVNPRNANEQIARLPVFGATDMNSSYIGIVKSGDTRANIKAAPPSGKEPYGTVYAEFIYRELIPVSISQQTFENTQANLFEPEPCSLKEFSVEYRFPDAHSYIGMADEYRDYLINSVGIKPVKNAENFLNIKLIGGIMHSENLMGIPVDRVLPVTKYSDVSILTEKFNKKGIDSVYADYLFWNKKANDRRLTLGVETESRLGSRQELEEANRKMSGNGRLYLDLNFSELYSSHKGYSIRYDTARTVLSEPLSVFSYFLSTYQKDAGSRPLYLLKSSKIQKAADKFLSDKETKNFKYSLNSMGSMIYSDFDKKVCDRSKTVKEFTDIFAKLKKHSGGILFDSANAYALPFADAVSGVPTDCSYFLCEKNSVPFYSAALHGIIPMSSQPLNNSRYRKNVLKAVENGISLSYTLGVQNTNQFKDTEAYNYYYIDSDYWFDKAVEDYSKTEKFLDSVKTEQMKSHTELQSNVYKTEFEGGKSVTVNYNSYAVSVNGENIPAMDFILE